MLRFSLCVLSGIYSMHQAASLPSAPWLITLAVITVGIMLNSRLRPLAAVLLGSLLIAITGHLVIGAQLPSRFEGQTVQLLAVIDDFPSPAGEALRLVIKPLDRPDLPPKIRLSWYEPADIPGIGEVWQLTARLRAPRGLANPRGFDYEGWLFRQRIGATGYVVAATKAARQPDVSRITRLRSHFLQRTHALLPDDAARAVLTAITIGARQNITRKQWDQYARTGTSHLMAISGLHVGLAAAGMFLLVRVLGAPFARGRNIRDAAVLAAATGAAGYALISGLAVPAQRALLMVMLVSIGLLQRRQLGQQRVLSLACLVVLAADPLAALTPGFQLSFLAVAVLLWCGRQYVPVTPLRQSSLVGRIVSALSGLSRIQLVLLFGLLPLTALHFGRITWLAPMANFVALPVFNLCTVPLSLAAIVLDGPLRFLGDSLLWMAHASVVGLLWFVDQVAKVPLADLRALPEPGVKLAVLWATALFAALPPGFPGRYLAWIATLFIVLHRPPVPPADCVDLHILDVGQGLSAVAQTRTRAAVFDTGPAFRSGSDAATLVLVPFLRSLGLERIDTLIVSHADLDHAGGIDALLEQVAVGTILYGEELNVHTHSFSEQSRCTAGQAWHWDGVDFRILHPSATANSGGNAGSCVLEISTGSRRALFTGDIEAPAERLLLARNMLKRSRFVVVPHHGSRTSSTADLVAALDADLAVVSAGFGNRWGFPKPEVVRRWQGQGAKLLSTASSGAISQRLCVTGAPHAVIEQRHAYRRYWHATP